MLGKIAIAFVGDELRSQFDVGKICDRSLMLGKFAIGFVGGELRSQFDFE
jgi:hypothetical protein